MVHNFDSHHPFTSIIYVQTYTRMLACHSHMLHVRTYVCMYVRTRVYFISLPLSPHFTLVPFPPHSLPHILTPLPPSHPHPFLLSPHSALAPPSPLQASAQSSTADYNKPQNMMELMQSNQLPHKYAVLHCTGFIR